MFFVLILFSCLFSSSDAHSRYNFNKYQKHFIEKALKKPLDSLSEDEVMEFWDGPDAAGARYTIGIYLAELMRRYFRERGLSVPDTTWYNFWVAYRWLESNEDFKRDSVNNYILNFFEYFLYYDYGRSGVMFTKRLENIRIEKRIKVRLDYFGGPKKWDSFLTLCPRQVVAVYNPLIYHFGDGCNMEEIWRNMAVKDTGILLTWRPRVPGIVRDIILNEVNGGEGLSEGKLLLISYTSGKAVPRWRTAAPSSDSEYSFALWGNFTLMDIVSDNDTCVKAIKTIAVLKEDGWHRVKPVTKRRLEDYFRAKREGFVILDEADIAPFEELVYFVSPKVIFTDDVVQSVLKFIRKELPVLKQER